MAQEFVSPVAGSNSQYLRLSGPIEHDSIVNGYGLRAVIWTQGCFIGCEGCQNQETWDPEGGVLVSVEDKRRTSSTQRPNWTHLLRRGTVNSSCRLH